MEYHGHTIRTKTGCAVASRRLPWRAEILPRSTFQPESVEGSRTLSWSRRRDETLTHMFRHNQAIPKCSITHRRLSPKPTLAHPHRYRRQGMISARIREISEWKSGSTDDSKSHKLQPDASPRARRDRPATAKRLPSRWSPSFSTTQRQQVHVSRTILVLLWPLRRPSLLLLGNA